MQERTGESPLVRPAIRAVRGSRRTPWRSARRSRARSARD